MNIWPAEQAHLKALFEAYVEVSGCALTASHQRKMALREMDRRGLTADDVRAVIGGIKSHLQRGTNGYTDASLDWRNAMGDVDTFEERAIKVRQAKGRKRGVRPVAIVPQVTTLANGEMITRLAPAPVSVAEAETIAATVKKQAEEFRRKMRGEQA